VRREHVPERPLRGDVQTRGAAWLARGECGRPSRTGDHPVAVDLLREIGIPLGPKTPRLVTPDLIQRAVRVVTFGCLDRCPIGAKEKAEDWPVPGATGKSMEELRTIRDNLRDRVEDLTKRLPAE